MTPLRAVLSSTLLASGAVLAAQSPQPMFRSSVTLVPLDVRVIDREGKPVTDLTAADFRVSEDGVPQPIVQFWREVLVSRPPDPAMRAHAVVPAFDGVAQTHRIFLIVVGAGALGTRPLGPGTAISADPSHALEGLLHLVRDRLLPQDQVAVLAGNRATDFSTNHELAASALERVHLDQPDLFAPAEERMASADAELGFAEYVRARATPSNELQSLAFGIKYVRFMPGEKHLIYVTAAGVRRPMPGSLESLRAQPGEDMDHVAADAADARVALHVIHTGGVPATPAPFLAPLPTLRPLLTAEGQAQFGLPSRPRESSGSGAPRSLAGQPGFDRPAPDPPVAIPGLDAAAFEAVGDLRAAAETTGGRRVALFADARQAVERIDDETRVAYLLAYRPANAAADGKYRSVRVEVNRPGVTVRFRRGYHASPEAPTLTRRAVLADGRLIAAAASTRAVRGLPFTASPSFVKAASGRKGEVVVRLQIEASRLPWTTDELGRRVAHLDVAIFCGTGRNKTVGQARGTADVALTEAALRQALSGGFPYTVRVPVDTRPTFVKVVLYNYETDLAGSVVATIK